MLWPSTEAPLTLRELRKRAAPDFAVVLPPIDGCAAAACRAAHLSLALAQPLRALLASSGMLQVCVLLPCPFTVTYPSMHEQEPSRYGTQKVGALLGSNWILH